MKFYSYVDFEKQFSQIFLGCIFFFFFGGGGGGRMPRLSPVGHHCYSLTICSVDSFYPLHTKPLTGALANSENLDEMPQKRKRFISIPRVKT